MTNSLVKARAADVRAHILAATLFVCALAFGLYGSVAHAAEPTLPQVYAAANAGDFKGAQAMMDQVLAAHPNSAKAHFVEAELLAKQGQIAKARSEFTAAERIDPALSSEKPEAVQSLRARLSGEHAANAAVPAIAAATASAHAGPSWGLIFVVVALVAAIVFFMRARSRAQYAAPQYVPAGPATYNGYGGGYGQQPYGQPYGPMGPTSSGGMGSGILGGLATGAAVGAGMVAGEALMHRMMDGGNSTTSTSTIMSDDLLPRDNTASNYDMGGNDFGVNDASSWDDDTSGSSDW